LDYDKVAGNVARALTKYGRPVTLRQYPTGGGSYDVALGKVVLGQPVDTTRQALTADQPGTQIQQRFGQNRNAGSLVGQGEKWIYLDAQGPKPRLQDRISFDNTEYAIIDVQELKPGLVPLFYLVVLRA
jgi:hypothetical protein